MKIQVINDFIEKELPKRFKPSINIEIEENPTIWFKTDLKCPVCGTSGMVVKICCNGELGMFHGSSGIILGCEKTWNKNICHSEWNREPQTRAYPWHTWLTKFHEPLDLDRGSHGKVFIEKLKEEYPEIYNQFADLNNKINNECKEKCPYQSPTQNP